MSKIQFNILIFVIIAVGLMVAFGPDYLQINRSAKQAERDQSVECVRYRNAMIEAMSWQKMGNTKAMEGSLLQASKHKKAGNCSDYY